MHHSILYPIGYGNVKLPMKIQRSREGSVCILSRVTAANPDVDITSIGINDPSADYTFIPISRSYDNGEWTRIAGSFVSALSVDNCNEVSCSLEIDFPSAGITTPGEGKIILMAFEHSLKNEREELSRFLIQTTFGPTTEMINGWVDNGYTHDLGGYAKWTKDQMNEDEVAPTLHREFYRKYADFSLYKDEVNTGHFSPRYPCLQYSRWRDHSFTPDDYEEDFDVIRLASGQFLVAFNGIPRTVVDAFAASDWSWSGAGQYTCCK